MSPQPGALGAEVFRCGLRPDGELGIAINGFALTCLAFPFVAAGLAVMAAAALIGIATLAVLIAKQDLMAVDPMAFNYLFAAAPIFYAGTLWAFSRPPKGHREDVLAVHQKGTRLRFGRTALDLRFEQIGKLRLSGRDLVFLDGAGRPFRTTGALARFEAQDVERFAEHVASRGVVVERGARFRPGLVRAGRWAFGVLGALMVAAGGAVAFDHLVAAPLQETVKVAWAECKVTQGRRGRTGESNILFLNNDRWPDVRATSRMCREARRGDEVRIDVTQWQLRPLRAALLRTGDVVAIEHGASGLFLAMWVVLGLGYMLFGWRR